MIWTPENTFKFIELYKQEPSIWEERSPQYKDKNLVAEAWERLSEEMEIPVVDLKRRKESLMSGFRLNYKKKIYEGFKPTWVFYDVMESFLKDLCEHKILNNPKSFIGTPPPEIKNKITPKPFTPQNMTPRKINRSKSNLSEVVIKYEEDSEEMTQVLDTLNYVLDEKNQAKSSASEEDECELYGRLIARRLLAFPYPQRQELMYQIDGLVLKRRLEMRIDGENSFSAASMKRRRSTGETYVSPDSSPTHIIYRPPSESD